MKEKQEQIVMRISFWSGVVFALAELIMAIYSKSQSVLADTVYDSTELVVIGLTIYIIPLFYKPVTEKHPFGYAQLESIVILLKGFMFIAVMMVLIMNNVQIMLNGGNEIDHMQVSMFETILTCFSALILFILMQINKKVTSPTVDVEIYGWKIDVFSSVGVSLAFFLSSFLTHTPLAFISPYFDQIVAIVLALGMMKEPIQMIGDSFRSLMLLSPDEEEVTKIKHISSSILNNYPYDPVFYDITTTGRKMWISIYFTTRVETVVLLSHKKPDGHINVKVEFGEGEGKVPLDNIAKRAEEYKPKERVTYKMIKEYIEAKYGFKVHTAYIAEVKRDLGLPMYDAPNAVEELKQPRKHPTAEKVEAIKDALKHFEVI
ncbi:cation transporter [Holdemanella biformis]|uniref:cation transporter n=1 Tax=Holdemanella biformis TaxID=1735 RepID=UPI0022E6FEDE|nr:cation transporter [Holdemanella biformis]